MSAAQAFNVVGIVVHAAPARLAEVSQSLATLPGVDVHASTPDGRLVATATDTAETMAIDQLAAMSRTPGVVTAMLAYHQIDHTVATPAADPCACGGTDPHCHSHTKA